MEYRGKHYAIVLGIGPHSSKGKVHLDQKTSKLAKPNHGTRREFRRLADRQGARAKKGEAGPGPPNHARRPFMSLPRCLPVFPLSLQYYHSVPLSSLLYISPGTKSLHAAFSALGGRAYRGEHRVKQALFRESGGVASQVCQGNHKPSACCRPD